MTMNRKLFIYSLFIVLIFSGCKKNNEIISYHKFNDRTWNRFEKINFDIPILNIDKQYDVYFFANHTKDYEFDNLRFNMIMTTPSGEERIKDYKFLVKNETGGFIGKCSQDSCTESIALKKGLQFEKKGMLRIEIETLVPRLQINNLLGVGIRLIPSGQ
jgi:gliding motility-associated lipoprotein GldH